MTVKLLWVLWSFHSTLTLLIDSFTNQVAKYILATGLHEKEHNLKRQQLKVYAAEKQHWTLTILGDNAAVLPKLCCLKIRPSS